MRIPPTPQHSKPLPTSELPRSVGHKAPTPFFNTGHWDTLTFKGHSPSTSSKKEAEAPLPQTSNWLLGRGRKNNDQALETVLVLQPDHQMAPPTFRVLPPPNPVNQQNPIHRRRATSAYSGMLPMVITTVLGASLTVLNLTALWARETDENKDYTEKKLIASLGLWGIGLVVSSFIQNRNELRDLDASQD